MTDDDRHHELSAAERDVLERMTNEKRVNTQLLVDVTTLSHDEVETALGDLAEAGLIREVTTDLYEIAEATSLADDGAIYKGIPDPNPDTQTAPIDPTNFDED